jgi:PAS domain S-box-containing protein
MDSIQEILIVDDRPEELYACRRVLNKIGAEITEAASGNDALKASLHHDFALAVLDVKMPGMNGYELAEILRSEDKTKDLPIILLSGIYTEEMHIFRGYDSGAVDFITKPFNPRVLVGKVKAFLALDRQKRERKRLLEELREANVRLSTEIAERTRAEVALKEAKDLLEIRVEERTSELRKANEALRESENRLRRLFDESPVGAAIISLDHCYLAVNPQLSRITGYSEQELLSMKLGELTHPDDLSWDLELARQLGEGRMDRAEMEKRLVRKDGQTIWVRTSMRTLRDESGRPQYFFPITEDITEAKQREAQIRSLAKRLTITQEDEWRRISRELHDTVGQDLAASKLHLEVLRGINGLSQEARRQIARCSEAISESLKNVRHLSYSLRGTGLDRGGLATAMQRCCQEFAEKEKAQVAYLAEGMDTIQLSFDRSIHLYRIFREALSNIAKHAQATHVTVRLLAAPPHVILRIEDNGRGFDPAQREPEAAAEGHIGLCSMKERTELLRGTIRSESQPGNGTNIWVRVPIADG